MLSASAPPDASADCGAASDLHEQQELVVKDAGEDDTASPASLSPSLPQQQQQQSSSVFQLSSFAVGILTLLVVNSCVAVLLTHHVHAHHAVGPSFRPESAVLCSEALKCAVSLWLLHRHVCGHGAADSVAALRGALADRWWLMLFPAAVYFVENVLYYLAAGLLAPEKFTVVYQSKLVLTALAWKLTFPQHVIGARRWGALGAILAGIILAELHQVSRGAGSVSVLVEKSGVAAAVNLSKSHQQQQHASSSASGDASSLVLGIFAVLGCACCSAAASVYLEAVIKRPREHDPSESSGDGDDALTLSLHARNAQLSGVSVFVGLATIARQGFHLAFAPDVLLLVCVNAAGGLCISAAIVFATSMHKSAAAAAAVVCLQVISVAFGSASLSLASTLGAVLVVAGTFAFTALK